MNKKSLSDESKSGHTVPWSHGYLWTTLAPFLTGSVPLRQQVKKITETNFGS